MYNNQIKDINETNNGDIIVSGYINENSFINPPEDYSYIFRYNSSGDSVWAKTFNNLVFNSLKMTMRKIKITVNPKCLNKCN